MQDRILYSPRDYLPPKRPLRKRGAFIFLGALLLVLFLGGGVYALRLPQWQIKNIKISGLEALGEDEVRSSVLEAMRGKYVFFIPRSSIFLTSSKTLEYELAKKFPRIKTLDVSKKFPDTLEVSLMERKLWGILCSDPVGGENTANCVYVDKEGFTYENAPESSGSLIIKLHVDFPKLNVGERALQEKILNIVLFLDEELPKLGVGRIVGYEYSLKTPREIKAASSEGFKMYFNVEDNFPNVFRVLKTVLNEEIKERRSQLKYIDLRFGNKVFYKLR